MASTSSAASSTGSGSMHSAQGAGSDATLNYQVSKAGATSSLCIYWALEGCTGARSQNDTSDNLARHGADCISKISVQRLP
jgi:hypothetical protein